MNDETVTDALLRQFLLGKVDDEERERIESLFVTGHLSRDRLLTIEQELIEDHFEGALSEEDREQFLLHFANTTEQQRKLRIAKSVHDWATTEGQLTSAVVPSLSIWSRLRARVRLKPLFFIPIAATTLIGIMVTAVWLNRKTEQESRQHLAVEQEFARLNNPASLREVPSQMAAVVLKPVSVRSVGVERELVARPETRVVELRLLWIQKEQFSAYQAVVRRQGDEESFTIRHLQPGSEDAEVIRLRLPTSFLSRGTYLVELSGIAADGVVGSSEEYKFTVSA